MTELTATSIRLCLTTMRKWMDFLIVGKHTSVFINETKMISPKLIRHGNITKTNHYRIFCSKSRKICNCLLMIICHLFNPERKSGQCHLRKQNDVSVFIRCFLYHFLTLKLICFFIFPDNVHVCKRNFFRHKKPPLSSSTSIT